MKRSVVDLTAAEIDKLARDAWGDAARQALERGLPVTGSRDGRRFRYYPDHHVEDLGPVDTTATERTVATPDFTSPKLYFQHGELAEAYREMAEVSISQATDAYQRAKAELQKTTNLAQLTNNVDEAISFYRRKLLDITKTNTNATLDFAQELVGVKSASEAMELWVAHARRQFETFAAQAKELAALTQRIADEIPNRRKAHSDDKDSSKNSVA
jgi:hypothetical protein